MRICLIPRPRRLCALALFSLLAGGLSAADTPVSKPVPASVSAPSPEVERHNDLVYGEASGQALLLNLSVPKAAKNPPLVVYIHGGSWRAGTYKKCPVDFLAKEGFAVASIEYRFSKVAPFPAQIHDCKGAIRWLRANAKKYGCDAEKIGVAGASAGGHLATLLGTSGGVADLEGDVGGNTGQSSRVAAVVDYYGPVDFVLAGKTQPSRNTPESGTYQLLQGAPSANPEKARRAGSVTYISPDDPPLLILHGDADQTVLLNQSEAIRDAYKNAGLPVELIVLPGARHGGKQFNTPEIRARITAFFRQHLISPKK
ncbi:MAG: alpha/beta hydrolase [Opitutaceae bacterium]|nr:alpha/beta hydrolase [Opitutaceae bacterium]